MLPCMRMLCFSSACWAGAEPATFTLQPRKPMQMPARAAQVQKEDTERKEQEEQQALVHHSPAVPHQPPNNLAIKFITRTDATLCLQFAQPLPGSTPSTQHLAGKKAAKEKRTVEVRAQAESAETASPVSSPQKHTPSRTQNQSGGRVNSAAEDNAESADAKASTPAAPEAGHRPGFLKGFKKLLSGKSKF